MNHVDIVAHKAKESDTMEMNRTYYIGLIDARNMPYRYRQRPGVGRGEGEDRKSRDQVIAWWVCGGDLVDPGLELR